MNRFERIFFSGALGLTFVAVTQLLQVGELDEPLSVSLYCFAAALPITAAGVVLGDVPKGVEGRMEEILFEHFYVLLRRWVPEGVSLPRYPVRSRGIEVALGLIGLCLSFGGMGAVFWHLNSGAAVLFLAISTPTLIYVGYVLFWYSRQHAETETETEGDGSSQ